MSIAKHRGHVFTFLTAPDVSLTNNDSAKALRPVKTKLKVSGCFRTEAGAYRREDGVYVVPNFLKP